MTTKKELSERDICTQYIIPAIKKAGWNIETQIREEVFFTDGRIFKSTTSQPVEHPDLTIGILIKSPLESALIDR